MKRPQLGRQLSDSDAPHFGRLLTGNVFLKADIRHGREPGWLGNSFRPRRNGERLTLL